MANLFLNLPAPAANAAGADVDVTTLGATKTVVVKGNGTTIFEPFVIIEVSCDAAAPTTWTPVATFTKAGEQTFNVACNFMRARVTNYTQGGAPTVDVGSTDVGTQTATLVAPAGNGNGAGVDISALGDYTTVQVSGTYKGSLNIEVSNDGGTSWGPANMTFVQGAAPKISSTVIVAEFMRVSRSGIQTNEPSPGLPVIHICGSELAGSSPATGIDVEQNGVAVTGGPFDTLDFLGQPVQNGGGGKAVIPMFAAFAVVPSAITGAQNNYNPTDLATHNVIRQDLSAAASLTGLATGATGRTVTIFNVATALDRVLTLNHENAGSTAANRFVLPNGQDWLIPPGGCATVWYDVTSSRWRLLTYVSNMFPAGSLAVPGIMVGGNLNGWFETAGARVDVAIVGAASPVHINANGLAATGQLDADSLIVFEADISPAAIGGAVNDYAPTGFATASTIRQDLSAAANITGLAAGSDGRIIMLHNIDAVDTLTLNHDNAGSTAANRFFLPNNASVAIRPNGSVTLRYDSTSSRWRLIASAA